MKNSLKEKIRYWFEFLRLANESNDPIVINALKNNDIYKKWGDYRSVKFSTWWSNHSSLFKNEQVLSIPLVGEIVDSEFFYIKIPFTYAATSVGRIVAEIYDRELSKRVRRTKKSRKIYQGDFKLTSNEYQVAQFHYYLVFTRDVYLPLMNGGIKNKNQDFLHKSKEIFGKLKKKSTLKREIPFTNKNTSNDSDLRLVRRYRQYAEKLLRNVSRGDFPGDYEETFIKNQSQLRAEKIAKKKDTTFNKANRTPKYGRTGPIKHNSDDPYFGSIRKTRSDKGLPRKKIVLS